MTGLRRALAFADFTLREYVRSGRIVVEAVAVLAAVWLLFWPRGSQGLEPGQFFVLGGLFLFILSAYTTLVMMRLGNRPEGYVLLVRPLGRTGYLLGLYLTAIAIVGVAYLALSGLAMAVQAGAGQPLRLDFATWALGSLPLLLDAALVAAFFTLLSALVLPADARLLVLALLVLAFSADLTGGLPSAPLTALRPLQSLLSLPLLPATAGFALATAPVYDTVALRIIAGQAFLLVVVVGVAVWAFARRDIVLPS